MCECHALRPSTNPHFIAAARVQTAEESALRLRQQLQETEDAHEQEIADVTRAYTKTLHLGVREDCVLGLWVKEERKD